MWNFSLTRAGQATACGIPALHCHVSVMARCHATLAIIAFDPKIPLFPDFSMRKLPPAVVAGAPQLSSSPVLTRLSPELSLAPLFLFQRRPQLKLFNWWTLPLTFGSPVCSEQLQQLSRGLGSRCYCLRQDCGRGEECVWSVIRGVINKY